MLQSNSPQDQFIGQTLIRVDDYYHLNGEFPSHVLLHPTTLKICLNCMAGFFFNFVVMESPQVMPNEVEVY